MEIQNLFRREDKKGLFRAGKRQKGWFLYQLKVFKNIYHLQIKRHNLSAPSPGEGNGPFPWGG